MAAFLLLLLRAWLEPTEERVAFTESSDRL